MKVDLNGKVALVTGSAAGIGRGIADAYAANGAKVVYSDVNLKPLEEVSPKAPAALIQRMDISNLAEVEKCVDEIVAKFGRIDILVNNAGINTVKHRVTIDQFPIEEWDKIVNVDLRGSFLVSRKVAQAMIKQKSGRIINIASVVGLVPLRLQCAFVAAKAGLVNLTKAMAMELAQYGILVNGIAPGSILTQVTKALFYGEDGKFKESVQKFMQCIPVGRPGTVEEIACAALFLAAPEATYVNGHVMVVDGGWIAGYSREF